MPILNSLDVASAVEAEAVKIQNTSNEKPHELRTSKAKRKTHHIYTLAPFDMVLQKSTTTYIEHNSWKEGARLYDPVH